MFDYDDVTAERISAVERQLCALLDSLVVDADSGLGSALSFDLVDVPLKQEAEAAAGRRAVVFEVPPWSSHALGQVDVEPETASLARLLERGVDQLEKAVAAERELARAAALRARALAAFARSRPSGAFDRAPGEVGAASAESREARPDALIDVSEWAADEVSVALGMSTSAAACLLEDSIVLVERLPATLALLEEGRIGWQHARVLTELLGPVRDEARAKAEARVLARVEGKTPTQLRVAARRAVLRADAAAATERLVRALRERQVRVFPGEDGMASLNAVLPAPVARACHDALEQYADACRTEGDSRTKAERMADCLADLVLRPGANGLPPVQARLTVVAAVETLLGGDEPGEVAGDLVPAPLVRELAYTLGLLPRPAGGRQEPVATAEDDDAAAARTATEIADEGAADDSTAVECPPDAAADSAAEDPRLCTAPADESPGDDSPADSAAEDPRLCTAPADESPAGGATVHGSSLSADGSALAALLGVRRVAGTALERRPDIAVVDRLSGCLLALTDATGLRRGGGLGPPPESPGYRPRAELDRFVRLRDRRCRFPGCRARPRRCDLDHTCPWPWGPTSHDNLCCLCEHHHRLSHQAPGWALRATAVGGLEWTTPGGQKVTTAPPRFGADDDHPLPEAATGSDPDVHPGPSSAVRSVTSSVTSSVAPTTAPTVVAGEADPPPF